MSDGVEYVLYSPEKDYSLAEMGFAQIGKGEYELRVDKKDVRDVHFEIEDLEWERNME